MRLLQIGILVLSLLTIVGAVHAKRITDNKILQAGQTLFIENCAVCHGDKAQGAEKNWQTPDADGKYPAPPLNGSAHAWHHPLKGLMNTISNGTQSIGGNMPAWKDKLTQDESLSIIVWLTSLWPDEIYSFWEKKNQQ
jgi:mono/diheme cytochrome c family protein